MKTITIISGTNRIGSNTLKVAKLAEARLKSHGVNVLLVDLSLLPAGLFVPEHYGNAPASFAPFQEKILKTDGILVITPEYNGSFPGVLKYFIDLLKFPESFHKMPAAFIGVSAGQFGAIRSIEQLVEIFMYREANIFGRRCLLPAVHNKLAADGTYITDDFVRTKFEELLDGFIDFIPSKE
jgi:chromate reductase